MKTIPLTRGHIAFVDDADFDMLLKYTWYAKVSSPGKYYAATKTGVGMKGSPIYMHHLLLPRTDPKLERDHINGDSLDNRRSNLRLVTHSQNQMNCRRTRSLSGIKGAQKAKNGKWKTSICLNGNKKNLGTFCTREEAAAAYARAAAELFGQYACNYQPPITAA